MTCFKGQFLLTATVVTPLLFAATEATAQTAKRFVVKGVVADAATNENHIANRLYIHRRTRRVGG